LNLIFNIIILVKLCMGFIQSQHNGESRGAHALASTQGIVLADHAL
jgi:hypothetical protein